ncbi:MAG: DnaA regulatory inactivator Hda [Pseudomonadales bacterium]
MSKQYTLALPLSPDATFANYVGEAGNKLAQLHYWNLIWGPSGTGRSHLLQALCFNEAGQTSRPDRIYLGELQRLEPQVLANLETFDVVCLDDVDDVLGHSGWEEALFHLLNSCKDNGTRVVMAAKLPAAQQDIKLADLKSRLNAALAVATDKLDDAQRICVMQRRASHWGFDLPHDVAEFILKRSPRDMVRLIDNLKRLELETLRAQRKVTIPFAKQTLRI